MMLCNSLRDRLRPWLRDYVRLQSFALILIYIQVHSFPHRNYHSLLSLFSVLNLNLFFVNTYEKDRVRIDWIPRGIVQWCIAYKFGDRIIRFGSRTYALLLFSAIFLDIFWFIPFAYHTWNVSSKQYGPLFTFSVKLTLAMQIIGFAVRLSSSLLWIRIYRSGISYMETPVHREISHFGNGDNSSTSGPDVSRSKLSRHFQVADQLRISKRLRAPSW
ncbi:uncharacterized protein LOC111483665 isoform X3 [Cucurbita maxima]|uniref:Uncharacterized protein LOC111483665 isoform X3 n=1 Tax=Cucurbita maxima TaxID=3661 RepID=A0A6J1JEC1_CUCMA|nr:uncharacterized protein LOC111483665 isoform X3 [Cucurbita maxima]